MSPRFDKASLVIGKENYRETHQRSLEVFARRVGVENPLAGTVMFAIYRTARVAVEMGAVGAERDVIGERRSRHDCSLDLDGRARFYPCGSVMLRGSSTSVSLASVITPSLTSRVVATWRIVWPVLKASFAISPALS